MKSFEYPIELKGKPCLYKSITKNVLYVGCSPRIFKLKIKERKPNRLTASCFAEVNVNENFEAFCVDEEQDKIVVATYAEITTFTLSPFRQVQTATIQSSAAFTLPSMYVIQDRVTLIQGNEIVCFSVSGQELFRCQIDVPYATSINCVAFDPLKNIYAVYSKLVQECDNPIFCFYETHDCNIIGSCCVKCGHAQEAHTKVGGVYQTDGRSGRVFISNIPNTCMFLFFNDFSKECVLSDGIIYTIYKLFM